MSLAAADAFMAVFGMKRVKHRRCPECGIKYVPVRKVQPTCGHRDCETKFALKVVAKAERKREKVERANDRQRLEELKPLQYWLKRTQKAVNELRREEDLAAGYGCITCDTHDAEEWHAGHCISVGASSAERFTYTNIHLQCRQCNYFGAGKQQEYLARLPARVGQAEVDRLIHSPRSKKWAREECQAIESDAKAKLKALRSAQRIEQPEPAFCA